MGTTSADLSALAGYAGQFDKDLIRNAVNGMDYRHPSMFFRSGVKTNLNLTKLLVNGQIKPFTGDFVPEAGDLAYVPRVLSTGKFQRDILENPDDYKDTWMQDDMPNSSANNKRVPYAKFFWDTILKNNMAQLNNRTAYFGVGAAAFAAYNAGTAYAVGNRIIFNNGTQNHYYRCLAITTAGQTPLTHASKWLMVDTEAIAIGWGSQIVTDIANIDVETTGVLTSSNTYAACLEMWRGLPEPIKQSGGVIYMSFTDYDNLVDDIEATAKYTKMLDGVSVLPKTDGKCAIVPCTWMSGSRRLIASAYQNLGSMVDLDSDASSISLIPDVYKMKAGLSATVGFGIRDLSALRVSDQV